MERHPGRAREGDCERRITSCGTMRSKQRRCGFLGLFRCADPPPTGAAFTGILAMGELSKIRRTKLPGPGTSSVHCTTRRAVFPGVWYGAPLTWLPVLRGSVFTTIHHPRPCEPVLRRSSTSEARESSFEEDQRRWTRRTRHL